MIKLRSLRDTKKLNAGITYLALSIQRSPVLYSGRFTPMIVVLLNIEGKLLEMHFPTVEEFNAQFKIL